MTATESPRSVDVVETLLQIARWCHPRPLRFRDRELLEWAASRFGSNRRMEGESDLEDGVVVSILDMLQRFMSYDGPLDVVVDMGAHYGALSMAALARGAKRVIAVEPCHGNYIRLRENLRAVADPTRSTAILRAVSDDCASAVSLCYGPNTGMRSIVYPYEGGETEEVAALSVEDLFATLPKVDYLKVDIEGAEWVAFLERPGLAVELKKVGFVDMECHGDDQGPDGYPTHEQQKAVCDFLVRCGWPARSAGGGHIHGAVYDGPVGGV